MTTKKSCSISGCNNPAIKRGWCNAHYKRWHQHGDPLGGGTFEGDPKRYFDEVVIPYSGDDCLTWPYGKSDGYGIMVVDGKCCKVHRLACEEVSGSPPSPKHEAAHSCGNGHLGCVNPRHLRWRTHKENMREMVEHGRGPAGRRRTPKTTCKRGHPLEGANLYLIPNGGRACRKCNVIRANEYRSRKICRP